MLNTHYSITDTITMEFKAVQGGAGTNLVFQTLCKLFSVCRQSDVDMSNDLTDNRRSNQACSHS